MSDDDLIRREDALAIVQEWTYCCDAEEAIAALPAVTVGVKPLVWTGPRKLDEGGAAYDAHTTCGQYIATDTGWFLVGRSGWLVATSLETAKAAAQADYEARILAALEPVAAARRYMGQIMAECDCSRQGDCEAAQKCLAEQSDPDPAAIREAALREAAALMTIAAENCRKQFTYPPKTKEQRDYQTGAIIHSNAAAAILALIPKGAADDRA